MISLDLRCAEKADKIIEKIKGEKIDKNKIENLVTKSLGVLQEDGVYAFFLYLKASKEKDIASAIAEKNLELLKGCEELIGEDATYENILNKITELASDIDKLFLAKQLLERTLVYARYHAKALPEKQKGD